jgi:hypothetical protein
MKVAVQDLAVVFDAFRFPFENENHGPTPAAYVQRLIGCVKNQNFRQGKPLFENPWWGRRLSGKALV